MNGEKVGRKIYIPANTILVGIILEKIERYKRVIWWLIQVKLQQESHLNYLRMNMPLFAREKKGAQQAFLWWLIEYARSAGLLDEEDILGR